MSSVIKSGPDSGAELRAERRAAREAANRRDILDAAERVFGEHGVHGGSIRRIAELSGFSTGAIYLFFDNKQHLLSETFGRRGTELVSALQSAAASEGSPLLLLHRFVDVTVAFFRERPNFRRLLRQGSDSSTELVGPTLAGYAQTGSRFTEAMTLLTAVMTAGQAQGQFREGDPAALAHLYSVLVNEHVLLNDSTDSTTGTLTTEQFHSLVEGAFRRQ